MIAHNQYLAHEQDLVEHFFESALKKSYLDERYIKYVDGRLIIFFKRNGSTPDTQVGIFDNFDLADTGFGQIEDPIVVAKRIAAKAEADAKNIGEAIDNIPEPVMEVTKK